MYRYKILIECVGTSFVGWQIQKTIQSTLSKLLKQKIILFSAGRTDAGVHLLELSAHFDVKYKIQNIDKIIKSLNFFLNKKMISIINIKKKKINFHARHSAKERIYIYLIQNRQKEINIEKFPYIFFLSLIFPLSIFNSQTSVWFMFLISHINIF